MVLVVIRLVAWWRELRARPAPIEPAGGWFWWEYRSPAETPAEPDDREPESAGRLLVRRDGSWKA